MFPMPSQNNFSHINSADALDALATSLDDLARQLRQRAKHLRYVRQNYAPIDDKKSVIDAANMALIGIENGLEPAAACRNVARRYSLPLQAIETVLRHKQAAKAKAERAQRDGRIYKEIMSGGIAANIAKRYGLTSGRVSQIAKEFKDREAARAAGLPLPVWRRLNR